MPHSEYARANVNESANVPIDHPVGKFIDVRPFEDSEEALDWLKSKGHQN
jgi:hypothetical protein